MEEGSYIKHLLNIGELKKVEIILYLPFYLFSDSESESESDEDLE